MTSTKTRVDWIDSLKGLTMLCVVLGRVALGYLDNGMYPAHRAALRSICNIVGAFEMPLFFVISGLLFCRAYTLDAGKTLKSDRVRSQMANLLALYVLYSVVIWAFKLIFSSNVNNPLTWKDILLIWCRTIPPYWYLYVLLILYAAMSSVVVRRACDIPLLACLFAVSAVVSAGYVPVTQWFEIDRLLIYAPFFLAGYLYGMGGKMAKYKGMPALVVGLVIVAIDAVASLQGRAMRARPILSTVYAFALSFLLIEAFQRFDALSRNPMLNVIGRHCLEVYVLHCFLTAGLRPVFTRLHVDQVFISVMLNLVISTSTPVLFALGCKRLDIHGLFFKPYSFVKRLVAKHGQTCK